ncbi:MAG: methyltransferase domain-containing protein [Methanomicrobiales archaeon]|nr:methyltransferase domain-containing protein [Methanomicrobiales archaeon]
MEQSQIFDDYVEMYDRWYDEHPRIYQSEVSALEHFVPWYGTGLEVGVGTARFAAPLHIEYGIDPSPEMAHLAAQREITAVIGRGECIPFCDNTFDFVLMATVICFVQDLEKAILESARVLKFQGTLILAFIDRESPLGTEYRCDAESSVFFRHAKFHTLDEVRNVLTAAKFTQQEVIQTVFEEYGSKPSGFVVIRGIKEGKKAP